MRLIDADQLSRLCEIMKKDKLNSVPEVIWNQFRTIVECSPTMNPIKHGRWIYEGKRGRFPACKCSVCGNIENLDWAVIGDNVNYCPKCGAKMDEDGE